MDNHEGAPHARLEAMTAPSSDPPLRLESPSDLALPTPRELELEAALKARDQLISVLGHQLRNALAPLVLLAAQFDPDDRRSVRLAKHLNVLTATIDRVSELSQLREGALDLSPAAVDLGEVVSEVIADLAQEAAAGAVEIRVHAASRVTGVWDRARVKQIVASLLHNAIRHGGGGLVEITIEDAATSARLTVQDRGPGIPAARRERLFDAFDHAVERRRGSLGVGLWIARTLARAMNGDLQLVESELPGARFCLTLGHG